MNFKPKLTSFRQRLWLIALVFAGYGAIVIASGRDPLHHGRFALILAVILSLGALLPGHEQKKTEPEKYHLT
jgi:hypothetical protein